MNEHEVEKLRAKHKPASEVAMPVHVKDKIYQMIDENKSMDRTPTSSSRHRSYGKTVSAAVAALVIVTAGIGYGVHQMGDTRTSNASSSPQNVVIYSQLQSVSYSSAQLVDVINVAHKVGVQTPYILTKNFTTRMKSVGALTGPKVFTVDYGNVKLYEGMSTTVIKTAITGQTNASFIDANQINFPNGMMGQWMNETVTGQSKIVLFVKVGDVSVAIVPSTSSTLPTPIEIGTMAQSLVDATAYSQTGVSKSPTSFAGVDMVNPVAGWAIGGGLIWRTVDRGKTWDDVTPQGFDQVNAQVDFYGLDRNTAWITVHKSGAGETTIYRGGVSGRWMESNIIDSGTPEQLHFVNQSFGWITLFQGAPGGSQQEAIYQTTDGGYTWRKVPSPPVGGDVTGVTFITAKKGFVTGMFGAKGRVMLYETSDEGQTWSRVDVNPPTGASGHSFMTDPPTFFGNKDGVMFVQDETGPLTIYHTTDGGNTWTPTTPVKPKLVNGQMTSFTFASPNDGFATDGTHLYTTTDGGRTWNIMNPTGAFADVTSIGFTSAQDGWAVSAKGELSFTTDDGRSWTAR